jgi:hypothetical protein
VAQVQIRDPERWEHYKETGTAPPAL